MESFVGLDPTGSLTGARIEPEDIMDVNDELNERRVLRPLYGGFEYGNYEDDDIDWTDGDTLRKASQFKEERRIAAALLAEKKRVEMVAAKGIKKENKKLAAVRAARAARSEGTMVIGPIDRHVYKRKRELDDYNPVDGSSASYPPRKKFAVPFVPDLKRKRSIDDDIIVEERVRMPSRRGPFTSVSSGNPRRKLPVNHADYRPPVRVPYTVPEDPFNPGQRRRFIRYKYMFARNIKNALHLENSLNGGVERLRRKAAAKEAQAEWFKRYADVWKMMDIRSDIRGSDQQRILVAEAVKHLVGRGVYQKEYMAAVCVGLSVAMKEFDRRDSRRPVLKTLKAAIRGAYLDSGNLRPLDDDFDPVTLL